MCAKDTETKYGGISKLNHWVIGLLIIGMLVSGVLFEDMPKGPDKAALVGLHKSFGATLLVLGLWRIVWRLKNGFPSYDFSISKMQKGLGHALHGLLMVMAIALPISGLIMGAAKGYPTSVFGLFTIPAFATKDEVLGTLARAAHGYGGNILIALIVVHILAGLKHRFIDKDGVLQRMTGGK